MAKKAVPKLVSSRQPTTTAAEVIPVITENQFRVVFKKVTDVLKTLSSASGTARQLIADAAKERNLHPGAFGDFKRLDKMPAAKRAEHWYNLKLYASWSDWDDQEDLWRRQAIESAQAKREQPSRNGGGAEEEAVAH